MESTPDSYRAQVLALRKLKINIQSPVSAAGKIATAAMTAAHSVATNAGSN